MTELKAARLRRVGYVLGWVGPVAVGVSCVVVTGMVLGWAQWIEFAVAAVALVGLVGLVVIRRRAVSTGWLRHVQATVVASMAVAALTAAVIMYAHWGTSQRSYDRDISAVAQRSAELAELMTTVSPNSRDQYMARLQPLMVEGMAASLKSEVLDPVPATTTQKGVVRAVGVQGIVDGIASVICVVEPTGDSAATATEDTQSHDIVLWLFLIQEDGQWKLRNLVPMTA